MISHAFTIARLVALAVFFAWVASTAAPPASGSAAPTTVARVR